MKMKVFPALRRSMVAATIGFAAFAAPDAARAQALECSLHFSMSGWSVFYKTASGEGTVNCTNGRALKVGISAKGGGITFGKSEIKDGVGKFSGVYEIEQVLGSYAAAEAHAGASKSAEARVLTNGDVSLALSGTGKGWDIGVAFGKFTLSRR